MSDRTPSRTRREILLATADEILEQGLRSARLDKILARAGVTKGALYHHFGSKRDLIHTVLEELLANPLIERWMVVAVAEDPLAALDQLLASDITNIGSGVLFRDATVSGLALQCAASDADTRQLLAGIHNRWRELLASAFRAGQERGSVDASVDADLESEFFIARYEGILNVARATDDSQRRGVLIAKLRIALEELGPRREAQPTTDEPRSKSRDSDFLFLGSHEAKTSRTVS